MFNYYLIFRRVAPMLLGAFGCVWMSHAQGLGQTQSFPDVAKVTVAVAGLTCSGSAQTFEASTFQIAVDNTIGDGGGAAGRIVFGNLLVQKPSDSCSLPLF